MNIQKELLTYELVEGTSANDLSNKVNKSIAERKKQYSNNKRDIILIEPEGEVQILPKGKEFVYIQRVSVYRSMEVRHDGTVKPLKKYSSEEAAKIREKRKIEGEREQWSMYLENTIRGMRQRDLLEAFYEENKNDIKEFGLYNFYKSCLKHID